MIYYAHSGSIGNYADWQLLADHLRQVAERASGLAQKALPGNEQLAKSAWVAGLLHDLGKYQHEWQTYLLQSSLTPTSIPKSVPHSIHGAALAWTKFQNLGLSLCIAGHHSGLHNWDGGNEIDCGKRAAQSVVNGLLDVARLEISNYPTQAPLPDFVNDEVTMWRYELFTRFLFSILIDADRLDTELHSTKRERQLTPLNPTVLLQTLDGSQPTPQIGTSLRLNDLRNKVYSACREAGVKPRGFFELTVPTGGGKTRSGMAFALKHAEYHKLRRVFVVIPYLSIIEQNAREYRNLFGSEHVLEHHSAVAIEEVKVAAGEQYQSQSPAELASENWDAPIVVTTSVQFLETLLAASTRRCRRLHNVAQSVIVFDEAQCLPVHILNPLIDVFRDLVNNWGCSIVFSTATQPAFRYSPLGLTHGLKDDELKPILTHELRDELYKSLQRVEFRIETATSWNWDELVLRLIEEPALCVLNIRRHAREVWDKLCNAVGKKYGDQAKAGVHHLSSSMCAEHRMDILGRRDDVRPGTVYQRLRDGMPCWVVSTQVIEAGVDIDFPRVFRALGPLDSIVQAAGRCNREGKLHRGEVVIFQPADPGLPRGLYQSATGEAATTLCEVTAEQLATDPTIFTKYFATIYGRADTDAANIQKLRDEMQYQDVEDAARVIDDGGYSVIVPYKKAIRWVNRIRQLGWYSRKFMRKLQRYSVNLRHGDFTKAKQLGLVSPLLPDQAQGPWVLLEGCYDLSLGVIIAGMTPEQLIV